MTPIAELLPEIMRIDPAEGVIEQDQAWWNWSDLATISDALADMFNEVGLPEGGRVGILLRSSAAPACAAIGCIVARRTIVTLNPLFPADKLAEDMTSLAPAILVGLPQDLASDGVERAIELLDLPVIALPEVRGGQPVWHRRAALSKEARTRTRPDILIELLTSGTTGTPKRIPLTGVSFDEALFGANAFERKRNAETKPVLRSGVRIITAPLTHISGFGALVLSLAGARPIALLEKFRVASWVDAVERHGAKVVNVPPAALRMILDADVPPERLSSLLAMRTGTAPLDEATATRFMDRYGVPVLQQYGATEFTGAVAGWTMPDFKAFYKIKRGSVGRMQSHIEGRIVDAETGKVLPNGAEGLLEVRGRQLGDPETWMRTTDIASLDDDGFLWIHGRADNAINRGGFKIHPDEIARGLEQHLSVLEAAVVGLKDPRLGEVPGALVVLKPGLPKVAPAELLAFAKEKLLPYQVPSRLLIVDAIPRNQMMKPVIPEVRALLEVQQAEAQPGQVA